MFFYLFILASFIICVLLAYITYLRKSHTKILAKTRDKKELTRDATELLHSLMSGGAVCVTQVIDPTSIFLHSPGGKE